ncbi:hypothetical protein METHPM2_40052 [Pseudomonas sp. PM2]
MGRNAVQLRLFVGASLLAKNPQAPCSIRKHALSLTFFASKLAPTEGDIRLTERHYAGGAGLISFLENSELCYGWPFQVGEHQAPQRASGCQERQNLHQVDPRTDRRSPPGWR